MASTIVYIGLHPETLDVLKQALPADRIAFKETFAEQFKETCKDLEQYQLLLIGEEVANPIRFAQDAFAHDKLISILLINDIRNYNKIKQALQFSPFIGPTVQSISNETGPRMAPILEDAMQRTAQRRSFSRMKSTTLAEPKFTPNALDKVRSDFTSKVMQAAPIGAILISGNGFIININGYALNIFNKSEKEVLGVAFFSLFPEQMKFEVKDFLLDGYIADAKRIYEIRESESITYLEVSVAPINLEATANYKLILLNDITATVVAQQRTQAHLEQLEKLNANLERVNAELDTFVYAASHDLKSPILNIEGLVTSLEYELGPARATVATELEHIKRSIYRFKKTVEELTEISGIHRSFDHETTEVELAELVNEVKQLLEREITDTGVTIEFSNEGSKAVNFHKKNLTSILYNLISNAIKYRSPDRHAVIKIRAWQEESYLCLSVKDNGLGIPADRIDRVFQLFKRMHTHVEGTGIGLYIVKRIAENYDGSISVESEEGKGAEFTVRLKEFIPIAEARQA